MQVDKRKKYQAQAWAQANSYKTQVWVRSDYTVMQL